MGIHKFKNYESTNLSFEEVFEGEYDVPLVTAPASVLDIGANEGAFSAWASEKWPQASVIAFEPMRENADLFRKNLAGRANVKLSQLAVGSDQPLRFFYGKFNSGECSKYDLGDQSKDWAEVPAIPATDLPSCEFVKVDAEGMESEILTGLDLSKTKAVVFEYHANESHEALTAFLKERGFETVEHRAYSAKRGKISMARPGAYIKPELPPVRPTKVFIGVPSFFHIDPHFHRCMMNTGFWLARNDKIHGEVVPSFGDSPHVGRSRNMMTRLFLEGDYTDLLFIDSDIVFSPAHVERILSHPERVVGGIYFKKNEDIAEACLNTLTKPILKENGLNQVAYIGTGFLRIKRVVFEMIIERWGNEIAYCPDGTKDVLEYNFWNLATYTFDKNQVVISDPERIKKLAEKYHTTPETAEKAIRTRWLSEDWWFCQRCMDLGIKVWADRHIALKHSGNILFPLDHQEKTVLNRQAIYGSHADRGPDAAMPSPAEAVSGQI
jgi:FkbM family methyltransferase